MTNIPLVRIAAGCALIALGAGGLTACSSGSHPTKRPMPSTAATASARLGDLTITGGYIPQPASPDVAAAYFTVTDSGPRADVLERVTTDVTASVMAMTEAEHGTTGTMADLPKVTVPAHGTFRFTQGHAHLMLQKPTRRLVEGDTVRMTVTFAHAGTATLAMPVVSFTGPGGAASTGEMSGMNGG